MRDARERVLDILEAIERIEKYSHEGRPAFEQNELIQVWVLHHLQILGEAVNALRLEFQQGHPEIPWASIVGMRNILVHQYFEIDTRHRLVGRGDRSTKAQGVVSGAPR